MVMPDNDNPSANPTGFLKTGIIKLQKNSFIVIRQNCILSEIIIVMFWGIITRDNYHHNKNCYFQLL